MLVLTRRAGQRIVIGRGAGAIIIEVREVDRGQARIGVRAPRHVPIWREEIAEDPPSSAKGGDDV